MPMTDHQSSAGQAQPLNYVMLLRCDERGVRGEREESDRDNTTQQIADGATAAA